MKEDAPGEGGRVEVSMVGLVVPVILHNIFSSAFDDMQTSVLPPFTPDGAVSLPDQLIIAKGIGSHHLYRATPPVTIQQER